MAKLTVFYLLLNIGVGCANNTGVRYLSVARANCFELFAFKYTQ